MKIVRSSFDFKKWCRDNGLKESTIETLRNHDLDSQDVLKLVHADNVGTMDDPLLKLGATEQPFSVPLERVHNNPQVFLGTQHQAQSKKEGELKPLLIPDFKSTANYNESFEDEQEIGKSAGARIVLRSWVAANVRIMHKLSNTGKLSGPSQIADDLSYTVKVAELLESHTLASVVIYDNKYRKLQHQYRFLWGSDLQHLHIRFLVKHRPLTQSNQTLARPYTESRSNSGRPPQFVRPICRQFNSSSGCNWPQCRFQHVCLVVNCSQPHPQHEHPRCPLNAHDSDPTHVSTHLR